MDPKVERMVEAMQARMSELEKRNAELEAKVVNPTAEKSSENKWRSPVVYTNIQAVVNASKIAPSRTLDPVLRNVFWFDNEFAVTHETADSVSMMLVNTVFFPIVVGGTVEIGVIVTSNRPVEISGKSMQYEDVALQNPSFSVHSNIRSVTDEQNIGDVFGYVFRGIVTNYHHIYVTFLASKFTQPSYMLALFASVRGWPTAVYSGLINVQNSQPGVLTEVTAKIDGTRDVMYPLILMSSEPIVQARSITEIIAIGGFGTTDAGDVTTATTLPEAYLAAVMYSSLSLMYTKAAQKEMAPAVEKEFEQRKEHFKQIKPALVEAGYVDENAVYNDVVNRYHAANETMQSINPNVKMITEEIIVNLANVAKAAFASSNPTKLSNVLQALSDYEKKVDKVKPVATKSGGFKGLLQKPGGVKPTSFTKILQNIKPKTRPTTKRHREEHEGDTEPEQP